MLLPSLLALSLLSSALASPQLDKYKQLARKNNGLLSLTARDYDELTQHPRDYSLSVVLTALGSQYKCQPCQLLQPEYALLAKQWQATKKPADGSEEHLFAYVDFSTGPEIFQRLGLQSAPTFQLFLPTEGPRATGQLGPDGGVFGFKAEDIATYTAQKARLPSLQFRRPVDKSKVVKTALLTVGGALGAWRLWPFLGIIFGRRYLWAAGSIFTILFMTSGYMWTQIRRPLYVQPTREGKINYIAGGYQTMLGAEVHIVSAIYGLLAFSTYTLAYTIPKLRDPVRQRLGTYVWTAVLVVMAGVLMNVFGGIKQPGYPFRIF